MKVSRLSLTLCLLGLISLPFTVSAGKLFKWIDRDGTVNFSDRPPEGLHPGDGAVEERQLQQAPSGEVGRNSAGKAPPRNPIEYAARSIFVLKGTGTSGTGFFISRNGYGITCKHVLNDGTDHAAILNDGERYGIKVVAENPNHDLALILVLTLGETSPLPLRDSITLTVGERVFAIGNPAGLYATVTDGVFTGLRESPSTGEKVIQFSAPINPGNSGGPLVDEKGQVVGVVTSKYYSDGKVPLSGLGFAVPSKCIIEGYAPYVN